MSVVLQRRFNRKPDAAGHEEAVILTITVAEDSFDPEGQPPANVLIDVVRKDFNVHHVQPGLDLIHAVYLAMTTASAVLYGSDAWRSGDLLWNGERDLGMPVLVEYEMGRTTSPWTV